MRKEQKTEFLSSRVRYISINDIRPNPQQPRRRFDQDGLRELSESIAAYGILQPLTVRAQNGGYELVAGGWRAARMAGLRQVPCLLARVDEEDAALLALIENLQRRDLDYMEEASAIARLLRRYGLSQQQAAEKLGRSQSAVANKLRLLRLEEPVVDALHRYGLTERHARALLRLEDGEQRLAAAEYMGKRGMNVAAQAQEHVCHQGCAAVSQQRGAGHTAHAGRGRGGEGGAAGHRGGDLSDGADTEGRPHRGEGGRGRVSVQIIRFEAGFAPSSSPCVEERLHTRQRFIDTQKRAPAGCPFVVGAIIHGMYFSFRGKVVILTGTTRKRRLSHETTGTPDGVGAGADAAAVRLRRS